MSSRGQANSIRSKKPRDRQTSHARDNSQESNKSETEPAKPQSRSREDGRRKDVSRSKTNKSPRKLRSSKDFNTIEKSPSSRSLSGRKEDKKGRNDSLAHEKSRESNRSPVLEQHALFPDNSKLSQLIGQLTSAQEDAAKRVHIAQQFGEYIREPTHFEQIKRSCSNLFLAMEDVFKERGHNEVKDQIALLYGSLAQCLGADCERFFKWVFSKIPSAPSDQLRIWYLRAVLEAMKLEYGRQTFYDAMPRVMASLQDILENADIPDLLLVVIDIVCIISYDYPDVFEEYFKDTVDILVGWHIDTTQSDELVKSTSDCLIQLHAYWVSDMQFSLTLLGQFIEDMEAYAEELKGIVEDEDKDANPSPYKVLPKLNSLVSVFTTVVSCIGDYFVPGRGSSIDASFINETVSRIIQCVNLAPPGMHYEKLLISANNCIRTMVEYLTSHFGPNCHQVGVFVNEQLTSGRSLSFSHLRSILSLIEMILIRVGVSIPIKFVEELFGCSSLLYSLRTVNDTESYSTLLRIFQSLFSTRNIPIVQAAYKFLVDDLRLSYMRLEDCASLDMKEIEEEAELTDAEGERNGKPNELETRDKSQGDTAIENSFTYHEAHCNVIFDLTVIAEIVTFKSSVVGAWKVYPPTFELLTEVVSALNYEIAVWFPTVQYCIIATLYTHSQRCNHFLHLGNPKGNVLSSEFSEIMRILYQVLTLPSSSIDSRVLCMVWITDIMKTIKRIPNDGQRIYESFSRLLDAEISSSYSIERMCVAQSVVCLEAILHAGSLTEGILRRSLVENLVHTNDARNNVRDDFLKILLEFPVDVIAGIYEEEPQVGRTVEKSNSSYQDNTITCRRDIWLAKKYHMTKSATGTLSSHHFKIIMGHILQGMHSNNDVGWIEEIYHACQRLSTVTAPVTTAFNTSNKFSSITDGSLPRNAVCSEELIWFWASWETAQFCLSTRLKTPLGKAMETFHVIEDVLRSLERRLRIASNNHISQHDSCGTASDQESNFSRVELRQSILLLQFLENLEKLMFNAFEGSAISLPQSARAVRNFYRTNKSTCHEWLCRIYEPACRLASMVGFPASAVRYGFSWLRVLRESNNIHGMEFEKAMVVVVYALAQLRAWESINGLLRWCKAVSGRSFFWLSGMISKSKGCLEKASIQLKDDLGRYLSPDRHLHEHAGEQKQKKIFTVLTKEPVIHSDPETISFLTNEILDCYVKLGDWNSVQDWCQKVHEMKQRHQSVGGLSTKIDMNYVKAMMKFEENDFPGVREQLELIPGATISSILQEQFPVLGTVKEDKDQKIGLGTENDKTSMVVCPDTSCSPSELAMQSQLYLLQALTFYWTSGLNTLRGSRTGSLHSTSWQTVEDLLTNAKDSLVQAVQNLFLCNYSMNSAAFLMQLKSLSYIRDTIFAIDNEEEHEDISMNISDMQVSLNPDNTDIAIMNEALRTANYLQFHHSLNKKGWVKQALNASGKRTGVSPLQVVTARLARKQGNIKLAESLLGKQLLLSEGRGLSNGKFANVGNVSLRLRQLTSSTHSGKVTDPLSVVEILRESAKLKYVLGNSGDAVDTICSGIILAEKQLSSSQKVAELSKLCEVSTKSVLSLVQWLLAEPKLLDATASESDDNVIVGAKIKDILKIVIKSGGLSVKLLQNTSLSIVALPECDKICGQLLHFTTHRSSTLSKTWFAYAEWCYRWGRKSIEIASDSNRINILDDERESILKALPKGTTEEDVENVVTLLCKVHCNRTDSPEEEFCGILLADNGNTDDDNSNRKHLVASFPQLLQDQPSLTDTILKVWRNVVDRIFFHFKQACIAYFKYLRLGDSQRAADINASVSEYGNITATLRLLRLLVKYSGELKKELETELSNTPTRPWKGIIPQLFARLNHPETYVQQCVANLLCRIARDYPHLIVYPSVVGCNDVIPTQISKTSAAGILKSYNLMGFSDYCDQPQDIGASATSVNDEINDDEEQLLEGVNDKVFQGSLHIILDSLSQENRLLVSEVTTVVKELRRITLLWDELWIGSLMQLSHEAQRRIQQLGEEIKRVNNNQTLSVIQKSTLIREKHAALMKPLVFSLERLEKITKQAPETKHEANFQQCYGAAIQKAIEKFRMPLDPLDAQKNWEPLKQLHGLMHARTSKRSMSCLSMKEISPILANGKFSHMPMPGIDFAASQVIYLKSFADDILILPTKTKPKKLVVHGSDGQRYTYLFKGLEDLHLDERITQFLEICNHMFVKEDKSSHVKYTARRYSVTPLGSRSGLIQWVDGSTPIFTLYKRWQQREMTAQNLARASQPNQQTERPSQTAPLRPSELFYNKITPLLKEKGIHDLNSNRREWPLPILKKVFSELSSETPSDLLAKEIWCASTNVTDWWEATKTYSRSVAVMSAIGYIIGLGDRHLDNILVDLATGEVVHIDYNVCFEKGKALRVAEKVPFRMTKNIESALGISGVEGLFRASCEKVLQILRHGREILLTLLEAFVYDPLVDWTTANDAAFAGAFYGGGTGGDNCNKYNRKEMERSITQTLLSTRVAEIRVSWTSNRDELHVILHSLESSLQEYYSTIAQQEAISNDLVSLQHQQNVLEAALKRDDHPLHSLQSRYDQQEKLLGELKAIKDELQGKIGECKQHDNEHKAAFAKVRGKEFGELYSEVCKQADIGHPCYGPAARFLQSAGQGNIVAQCDQMESELTEVLNQRRSSLRMCLDSLFSYATVVMQFPPDYDSQAWCSTWISWLEQIMADSSSKVCHLVLKEHDLAIQNRSQSNKEAEETITAMEVDLHQYFTEQSTKLVKLFDRRNQEVNETSVLSGPVTETWNAVRKFVGETGISGAASVACVTVTALITLNKRYLFMENAAAVSGERLMHLTSQDGDWFLDELCAMCGNIAQLLSVLKNNPLRPKNFQKQETFDQIADCMQVVFASVKVYASFQEFMSNFRTIIVPEAMRAIQNADSSFLTIIYGLKNLIENAPEALSSIVETLEGLSYAEDTDELSDVLQIVDLMRKSLNDLIEPEKPSEVDVENGIEAPKMTSGQMLVAGFSGLFAKVEAELSGFYDAFRKLQFNSLIDSIELSQEQNFATSRKMANLPLKHALNLLFIKRILVMDGFFNTCLRQAETIRDRSVLTNADSRNGFNPAQGLHDDGMLEQVEKETKAFVVFNEELLSLPVKQFIAESVQHFIIGLPSHSLTQLILLFLSLLNPNLSKEIKDSKKIYGSTDDLCKKAVDYNLKNASFTVQHLNKASSLIHAHGAAWRRHDLARRLENTTTSQKDIVQRAQLQLARFQWLNEDIISQPGKKHSVPLASPSRSSILSDINKCIQSIAHAEFNCTNLLERYTQLQSAIEQRLKWAAGANPALNLVQQDFETAAESRKQLLLNENKLSPDITMLANAIVRLETNRNRSQDAIKYDEDIVNIVLRCKQCCEALEANTGELGDVEKLMKNLKIPIPPNESITPEWMRHRLETTQKKIKTLLAIDRSCKLAVTTDKDAVKTHVHSVKSLLITHNSLVGDVKSLLKTLAKDEEAPECDLVRKFITSHNKFSEDASLVLKLVLQLCSTNKTERDGKDLDSANLIEKIKDLITFTDWLHDELLGFGSNLVVDELETVEVPQTFASALRNQSLSKPSETSLHTISTTTTPGELAGKGIGAHSTAMSPSILAKSAVGGLSPKRSGTLVKEPRTGRAQQEKNSFAMNVWRRVKAKLEGKDLDSNHRMTVLEQVDHVIKEATDANNLCQLYEGWTPWV